jgi:hypothetical protein
VIEKLKTYIKNNQKQLVYVRSLSPQNEKWIGTIDYAVARLNTLLLKLINTPLRLDAHRHEIEDIQNIIESFIKWVIRYYVWPKYTKNICAFVIHILGTYKIPKVKKMLISIDKCE